MKVSCPECRTTYRLDPRKIPTSGVRARCARCPAEFPVIPGSVTPIEVSPTPHAIAQAPPEEVAHTSDYSTTHEDDAFTPQKEGFATGAVASEYAGADLKDSGETYSDPVDGTFTDASSDRHPPVEEVPAEVAPVDGLTGYEALGSSDASTEQEPAISTGYEPAITDDPADACLRNEVAFDDSTHRFDSSDDLRTAPAADGTDASVAPVEYSHLSDSDSVSDGGSYDSAASGYATDYGTGEYQQYAADTGSFTDPATSIYEDAASEETGHDRGTESDPQSEETDFVQGLQHVVIYPGESIESSGHTVEATDSLDAGRVDAGQYVSDSVGEATPPEDAGTLYPSGDAGTHPQDGSYLDSYAAYAASYAQSDPVDDHDAEVSESEANASTTASAEYSGAEYAQTDVYQGRTDDPIDGHPTDTEGVAVESSAPGSSVPEIPAAGSPPETREDPVGAGVHMRPDVERVSVTSESDIAAATGAGEGFSEVERPAAAEDELPPPPFGFSDPHARARRLARALVSDIVVYHPDRRERSLRAGTIRQEFREEIRKSWDEYVAHVGNQMARDTTYFREALNELLAEGAQVF